jgi:hypothetical protein
MLRSNNIAFKEWAVVCAALSSGRQTIILRKGGIDEGREGFRVKHREFWLLPTRFHQDASQLTADARQLWDEVQNQKPPTGRFLIDLYAVVESVFEIHDLRALDLLAGEHILSAETIRQRFDYRHRGLFVLGARIYRIPSPHEVPDNPYIAGCKSWADLPQQLSTLGATPVLENDAFSKRLNRVNDLVTSL